MISPSRKHRILQLWYAGEKSFDVAAAVGVHGSEVYRIVKAHEKATLKATLAPEMRARLDELDRKLGFS